MKKVLDSITNYLKAVEKFQSGDNMVFHESALEELDSILDDTSYEKEQDPMLDPSHQSDSFNHLIESIKEITLDEDVIPYTKITKLIYNETRFNRELYDTLIDVIYNDWIIYEKNNPDLDPKTRRVFLKIKEHIGLSSLQRNHIDEKTRLQVDYMMQQLEKMKGNTDVIFEKLEKVERQAHEKSEKLVVHFITILGIFSSIIMGVFGSFKGFTSLFNNAESLPIGKVLIISATGISGVTFILFLLLHSISKLTSFGLSNCKCHTKRQGIFQTIRVAVRSQFYGGEPEPKCNCSLFNKYPTIILINYLSYYIAVTGFVFMYITFNEYFNMNFWLHLPTVAALYIIFTLLLIFVHRYILNRNSDRELLKMIFEDTKSLLIIIKNAPSAVSNLFK